MIKMDIPDGLTNLLQKFGMRGWYEKKFTGVFHTTSPWRGIVVPSHPYTCGYGVTAVIFDGSEHAHFWSILEMERLRVHILEQCRETTAWADRIMTEWQGDWKKLEGVYAELDGTDLAECSDDVLAKLHERLTQAYYAHEFLPYWVDSFYSTGKNYWLHEMIKRELDETQEKEKADVLNVLTAPSRPSFLQEEYLERLALGAEIQEADPALLESHWHEAKEELQKKFPELLSRISAHAKRFHWIHNNYQRALELKEDYFFNELRGMANTRMADEWEKEQQKAEETKQKKKETIERYGISRKLRNYIYVSDRFTWWHDQRKKAVLMTNHYYFRFLRELARRLQWEMHDAEMLACWEFRAALEGNIRLDELHHRKKGIVCFFTPDRVHLLIGEDAIRFDKSPFYPEPSEEQVEGFAASPGKAIGRAVLLKKADDIKEVKPGDILVASMTTPEYAPAFKKAVAIVTDQGGVTSHAAIVSREMGIPCIVGTKLATRTFRTGDRIEVDADEGVARILVRKK